MRSFVSRETTVLHMDSLVVELAELLKEGTYKTFAVYDSSAETPPTTYYEGEIVIWMIRRMEDVREELLTMDFSDTNTKEWLLENVPEYLETHY